MTKFSEFSKGGSQSAPTPAPEPDMIVDGCFGCQSCNKVADEADYFQRDKILRWKCEDGHVSFIEEFSL